MKIIELLNKIANGKEVPKKIKYRNKIYIYDKVNQCYVVDNYNEYDDLHMSLSNHKGTDLNYEVEIIEEETKSLTKEDLETLGYACGEIKKCFTNGWNKSLENKPFEEDKKIEKLPMEAGKINDNEFLARYISKNRYKINEIIDYINNKD